MRSLYSRKDISQMTMLSERTIRTYQKDGRLKGEKIQGQWVFSEEDLEEFFDDHYVKKSIEIKNHSLVDDFIEDRYKLKAKLCSIYDIPVEDEFRAEQFCNCFITEINNYDDGLEKISYYYDAKRKLVRLTLIGSPEIVVKLIQYCDLEWKK